MEDRKYTEKRDAESTINYIVCAMANEAAGDGFDKEFEDIVDLLMYFISPLIVEEGKTDTWDKIDKIGEDDDITDTMAMGKHKRERIKKKMRLAMAILHGKKMLFKYVDTFKWDFDPYDMDGSK